MEAERDPVWRWVASIAFLETLLSLVLFVAILNHGIPSVFAWQWWISVPALIVAGPVALIVTFIRKPHYWWATLLFPGFLAVLALTEQFR